MRANIRWGSLLHEFQYQPKLNLFYSIPIYTTHLRFLIVVLISFSLQCYMYSSYSSHRQTLLSSDWFLLEKIMAITKAVSPLDPNWCATFSDWWYYLMSIRLWFIPIHDSRLRPCTIVLILLKLLALMSINICIYCVGFAD